jgi:hypothetical protein
MRSSEMGEPALREEKTPFSPPLSEYWGVFWVQAPAASSRRAVAVWTGFMP